MHQIEISTPLDLPPSDVLKAAVELMEALQKQTPPYGSLSMSVNVQELKVPLEGRLQVPVRAHVTPRIHRWECKLEIGSEHHDELFPHFVGTLSISPEGHAASRLWLQGKYDPPLGFFGEAIDASVLRGVAKHSLEFLLRWMADDIRERVVKVEHTRLEQVRHFHA